MAIAPQPRLPGWVGTGPRTVLRVAGPTASAHVFAAVYRAQLGHGTPAERSAEMACVAMQVFARALDLPVEQPQEAVDHPTFIDEEVNKLLREIDWDSGRFSDGTEHGELTVRASSRVQTLRREFVDDRKVLMVPLHLWPAFIARIAVDRIEANGTAFACIDKSMAVDSLTNEAIVQLEFRSYPSIAARGPADDTAWQVQRALELIQWKPDPNLEGSCRGMLIVTALPTRQPLMETNPGVVVVSIHVWDALKAAIRTDHIVAGGRDFFLVGQTLNDQLTTEGDVTLQFQTYVEGSKA